MRVRKGAITFVLILAVSLFTNITLAASISGKLIDQISKEPLGTSGRLALYMYKEEYHYPWAWIASTSPDADGNFNFSGLEAGTYVIHGRCPDYRPEWYDDVQGSEGAPLVIKRAAMARATHIVLGEGEDSEVTVDLLPKLRKKVLKGISPGKRIAPAKSIISATTVGHAVQKKTAEVGEKTGLKVVILWRPTSLRAAPALPSLPARRLLPAAPAMPLVMIKGEGTSLKEYADEDGKVDFELPPGKYRIEVIAKGCKKWVKENFIKEDNDQDLVVELSPAESQPVKQ